MQLKNITYYKLRKNLIMSNEQINSTNNEAIELSEQQLDEVAGGASWRNYDKGSYGKGSYGKGNNGGGNYGRGNYGGGNYGRGNYQKKGW
jgi:hypothetical protein